MYCPRHAVVVSSKYLENVAGFIRESYYSEHTHTHDDDDAREERENNEEKLVKKEREKG